MPPQRTIPPAKAVKTERTHEENQERAYIAASRRSDRSLEARVESARRASEIHKRRTGRSLKVTEQDVINEEMYEEEDDDLPLQYRRLTQHLQTGSADFNKRLSAYLTQHVAMRSALEQGIAQSYAQQYPNAPQFQGQYGMYQSPSLAYQQPQQQQYRQQPYPPPSPQTSQASPGFKSTLHQRSASIATPQELTGTSQTALSPVSTDASRRMSMPGINTNPISSPGPNQHSHQPMTPMSKAGTPTSISRPAVPSFPQGSFANTNNFSLPQYHNGAFGSTDFLDFSTRLAPEAQQFLGSTLDPSDPSTFMFMAGSNSLPQYDFTQNITIPAASQSSSAAPSKTSGPQNYPTFDGLNSTLGPAHTDALETLELSSNSDSFFDAGMQDSTGGTGDNTPGAGEAWSMFMNDDKWDLPTGSQT